MNTLLRWMHDPRFGRVLAVLALVSITVLPNALEAQSSGCVAVTYGCPVSGPTIDDMATSVEQEAALIMYWWNAVILAFMIFTL